MTRHHETDSLIRAFHESLIVHDSADEPAPLLALIDIGTRAIIGYTLCLRREYGRYDVIRTLEKALAPAQLPKITIPDLEPIKSGGFVSEVFPETVYACWRQIRFDNARAHLAADSLGPPVRARPADLPGLLDSVAAAPRACRETQLGSDHGALRHD